MEGTRDLVRIDMIANLPFRLPPDLRSLDAEHEFA